uniref:NS2 n=1 Tax=uncultured densovirus TaxID=748192 RepID=A0A7L7YQR3_9VIRU|nr:NS2 [uncultured densovirus]
MICSNIIHVLTVWMNGNFLIVVFNYSEWKMNVEEAIKILVEAKLQRNSVLQESPGYLIHLAQYIYNNPVGVANENEALETFADCLQKIAKVWILNLENYPKVLYPDVIKRAKGLLGGTVQTSLTALTKPRLLEYVTSFEILDTSFTPEALASSVSMVLTCISSTTVPSQETELAGAPSSKKRKLSPEFDLDQVFSDQPCSVISQYPTGNILSFISQRKEEEEEHTRYEYSDEWKKYRLQLKITRTKDVKDIVKKDHWKYVANWMDLNFDENTKLHKSVKKVLEDAASLVREKGKDVKRSTRKY